jgi:hypothetical protein
MAERLVQREDEELNQTTMSPEAATLASFLYRHRSLGWWSAQDLAESFGWSLRKVRAVAAASEGSIVSGPGSKGYKASKACTDAERKEAANRLRSQAKAMNRKARLIESK